MNEALLRKSKGSNSYSIELTVSPFNNTKREDKLDNARSSIMASVIFSIALVNKLNIINYIF